mmetsp:Transcript_115772/g.291279  ORF Transcript_115772/g.291279 Transcript_115772/m.291279 type:complete len:267 (-) Transcript_115772:163-963(-)
MVQSNAYAQQFAIQTWPLLRMTPRNGILFASSSLLAPFFCPAFARSTSPKPSLARCNRFGWKGRFARKTTEEMPYSSVSGVWWAFISSCNHPALALASLKLNLPVPNTVPMPPFLTCAKLVQTNNAEGFSFLTSASTCNFRCFPLSCFNNMSSLFKMMVFANSSWSIMRSTIVLSALTLPPPSPAWSFSTSTLVSPEVASVPPPCTLLLPQSTSTINGASATVTIVSKRVKCCNSMARAASLRSFFCFSANFSAPSVTISSTCSCS